MQDVQISTAQFSTAGLDEEGIYRLNIKKMAVEEKVVKKENSPRKGEKYNQISGQVTLVERFGGEKPGLLDYPIYEFLTFFLNGNHLERFRKLYIAAFSSVPEAAPGQINISDLASALVGNDTIWTTLYWRRNRDDKTLIEQTLGWDFSTDPGTLRSPTPFATKDEEFAAANKAATVGNI